MLKNRAYHENVTQLQSVLFSNVHINIRMRTS
ncbi:MAG: hypothetical protein FD166_425 [Bacteroidetes bacterium]|nr:MAG: hypothetical protein FD166_425 [Bacteroidota bacterium]